MKNFLEVPDDAPADGEPEEAPDVAAEEVPEETPVESQTASDIAPAPRAAKAPADNTIVVQGNKPPVAPQDFENEAALFADDMQRGHVKPETLQGLYGKKDTLGKVGTLFGLLVSGVGSGLTGQPNAVLQMMNQEIERDLDAQKASNQNAQNWLRLSQAHQRQKAEIPLIEAQTKQAKAETSLVPYRQGQLEAQTNQAKAETSLTPYRKAELSASIKAHNAMADVHATTATRNLMVIDMTMGLQNLYNKAPPGPTKDAMGKYLNDVIIPARDAQIKQNSLDGANKINAIHAITTPPREAKAGGDVQFVDQSKIVDLASRARAFESAGAPVPRGLVPTAMVPALMDEAKKSREIRSSYKVIKDVFEKVDRAPAERGVGGHGILTTQKDVDRPHIVNQLIQSGMPQDEANKLADSMIPALNDAGKNVRQEKAKQLWEQFKTKEDGAVSYLRGYPGLLPPFPGPPTLSAPAKKGAKASAGKQYKVSGGVTYERGPKGEAIAVPDAKAK